jgi:hypothetical protein
LEQEHAEFPHLENFTSDQQSLSESSRIRQDLHHYWEGALQASVAEIFGLEIQSKASRSGMLAE